MLRRSLFTLISLVFVFNTNAQTSDTTRYWHGIERTVRYQPDGTDFVITNGNRRFTRALYGTNTAFRVEAGDLPEFALYMPGMGGNCKFGLIVGDSSKWLIQAKKITARYRPGSMIYDIEDNLFGKGSLHIEVLALADAEGMIIKASFQNVPAAVQLVWAYGGASGKKFSRDGDMGPDPESSFYLKPEYCTDNRYSINKNNFILNYGSGLVAEWDPYVNKNFATDTVKAVKIGKVQTLAGTVPPTSDIHVADASQLSSPSLFYQSKQSKTPAITGKLDIQNNQDYYFVIQTGTGNVSLAYTALPAVFDRAEAVRKLTANRIKVVTPDKWINTLGGIIGTAADAIWDSPTYMHGSIGWRMRLNGWRGPYVGDVLGWHDRAKTHYKAYSLSQVTSPLTGPVIMDTTLHLARGLEKMGTNMFTSGYISRNPNGDFRPHHYDMNLVFIDGLIRHFYWTGDLAFAKEMWPVITRHLAWEKRNFDSDDDGLYDAYAAIWASDALQYSGGAVTHSSAYNYFANREAAAIAKLIGEDGSNYEAEAAKIKAALNKTLWMPAEGTFAEFKDLLGNKMPHQNPAVWTIYHSLDSEVPDAFQAYQSMRYVDENIPHIPVRAGGLNDLASRRGGVYPRPEYYTISTSKWMPYDWSLNNVATAEVMHTALAYWQSGRSDKAFNLFKSELLSTMYLGGSPGNIGQISFYDAARGEAYRDFADPVAMTARSLVEGLFGINPNALKDELTIKPGFPAEWKNASIATPDIAFDFKRNGKEDSYTIVPTFPKAMRLKLLLQVNGTAVKSLFVNGKKVGWKNVDEAIGTPMIEVNVDAQKKYEVKIVWVGKLKTYPLFKGYIKGSKFIEALPFSKLLKVYDPQNLMENEQINNNKIEGKLKNVTGTSTVFIQLKEGVFTWWLPLSVTLNEAIEVVAAEQQPKKGVVFQIFNYFSDIDDIVIKLNKQEEYNSRPLNLKKDRGLDFNFGDSQNTIPGSNEVSFSWKGSSFIHIITNWNITPPNLKTEPINLTPFFNDKVTNIFKNKYLSPRPTVVTLQLPTQGIGDWTHPLKTAEINDKGLRQLAGEKNEITLPQGIVFKTPSDTTKPNIVFTSQWDNYPKEVTIPLTGKASHVYLMMAGSTNPMQSRIVNGAVIVAYTDGSADTLLLKNPETWWPIEQDYMDDGYAFQLNAARPPRVHLKTGKIISDLDNSMIKYAGKMIDGGAATVLDLPLNKNKTLKDLKLQTIANDVVIGLMSISLVR
jgi:Domain of unknown function (DUF4450)/Glycosyl-hydrolase family 116, catalytic region